MTRLTSQRQRELYDHVVALLTEHGYERLTMDQVAGTARISKATLYRQWGSKAVLVAEALKQVTPAEVPVKDTGSLRGDLRAWAREAVASPFPERELVTAVLHACKSDPELRDAVRARVVLAARTEFDEVYERAARRGEIDGDAAALAFVPVALAGPLILGGIIEEREIDLAYLYGYIDSVILPALGAQAAQSATQPAPSRKAPARKAGR